MLTSAIEALASLNIQGVAHHYAPDTLPTALYDAHLPALLILPHETGAQGLFSDGGTGLHLTRFSGDAGRLRFGLTHLLLVAPEQRTDTPRQILPTLVSLVDTTLQAIASNPRLNNTLAEPAQVRAEMGIFAYGETSFWGCAFRHEWILAVTP
jgi:hypothetical protein